MPPVLPVIPVAPDAFALDYSAAAWLFRRAYRLAARRYVDDWQGYGVMSSKIDAAVRLDLDAAIRELTNLIHRMEQ